MRTRNNWWNWVFSDPCVADFKILQEIGSSVIKCKFLDFLFRVQRFGNQGLSITAAMWSIVVGEVFQSSIESYIVTLIVTGNRCQSLPKDLNSWTHLQYLRGHKLTWVEATWPTLGEVLVFIAARCVYQLPVKSFKYIAALHFWAVPSQHVATSHQPKGQGQCKLHPYKEQPGSTGQLCSHCCRRCGTTWCP